MRNMNILILDLNLLTEIKEIQTKQQNLGDNRGEQKKENVSKAGNPRHL